MILEKHQIYFWQDFLCKWMMPVSEFEHYDGHIYVNLIASVNMMEISSLPKFDDIKGYLVKREVREFRRVDEFWEVPKDKYGNEQYQRYCIKKERLFSDDVILIPFDIVKSEYPELIVVGDKTRHIWPSGITPGSKKEIQVKRDMKLRRLLDA